MYNVLINAFNPDKDDYTITTIRKYVKDMMNLLGETRRLNTLRVNNNGAFSQLFSSGTYIHGLYINNCLYIDIVTHLSLENIDYVKLISGYFAPQRVCINQVNRSISIN